MFRNPSIKCVRGLAEIVTMTLIIEPDIEAPQTSAPIQITWDTPTATGIMLVDSSE